VSGAFVAGSETLVQYLENRARPHIYTTAQPPALAAACAKAIDLAESADALRDQVLALARRLRQGLRGHGVHTGLGTAHIVPAYVPGADRVMEASALLLDKGFFAQGLRAPTVPRGQERLRFAATALHTPEHIDGLVEAMSEVSP